MDFQLKLNFEYAPEPVPDLCYYDWIVVSSSAGKDSLAMLSYVTSLAREHGVLARVVVVHCDLGRVEWKGTRDLAAQQAAYFGVRFVVVRRRQGDLLQQIEERGMFPDPKRRYCTSDQKRGPSCRVLTALTSYTKDRLTSYKKDRTSRRVRILNCMGMRAEESPARAKKLPFQIGKASNTLRQVDDWLPLHRWTLEEVWEHINSTGLREEGLVHYAYDLGMPRLSCCFCIFAPRSALLLAGKHNRTLLGEYVRVEKKIGHTFRTNLSLASIQAALDAGETSSDVSDWSM